MEMLELFRSLPIPPHAENEEARFRTLLIPDCARHRIGKDSHGMPSLLIWTEDSLEQTRPAPIELEHLTVMHDVDCHVTGLSGDSEKSRFTIVRCNSSDGALQAFFLRVVGAVMASLGSNPSRKDVSRAIDQLVELFRTMAGPARGTIQGLWAELFLIARSHEPSLLVRAWHTDPQDLFDFSLGDQLIEVKSSTTGSREHHFNIEQLQRPAGLSLLIASVLIKRAGAGMSAAELADQIRFAISGDSELLLRFDRIICQTLGENWRRDLSERFDEELAHASLAFYEPQAVPSVSFDLPSGVSEVRFKSDLRNAPKAELSKYRAKGSLFRAALHR